MPIAENWSRTAHAAVTLCGCALLMGALSLLGGCSMQTWFNPSKPSYGADYPTEIPILERLSTIEPEIDLWGETSRPEPRDLVPSDLEYRIVPGDVVTVSIFELYRADVWFQQTQRVNASGYIRVPEVGDIPAAGFTAQELEDLIVTQQPAGIVQPQVSVMIDSPAGFRYTVDGAIRGRGMYSLTTSDLRVRQALANAGGAPMTTETVYVIRTIPLTEEVKRWDVREDGPPDREQPESETEPAPDIEELIERLEDNGDGDGARPGMFSSRYQDDDDDDLEPPQQQQPPVVDFPEIEERRADRPPFIYDIQRGEWVRVEDDMRVDERPTPGRDPVSGMMAERIIEIDYERLIHGDSSQNIVVRPDDTIYVAPPTIGLVFIDGEVVRPGVYDLPATSKLTLSRLIATAGGFGQLAVPEYVTLTRKIGENREATVRLNLAAIRRRTQPDIYLKPDDYINIGTTWWATPLAVIRNGFRSTYGFGFLLDRNFGNDVFGPPPTDRGF